jgi:heme-degrading monooxygenase HmoA
MVIVVFRTHVKPQADLEKLNALNQKMVALVSKLPGFLSIKDFSAQDGEFLVIAEFDSLESVDAWKAHPEHLVAQRRARGILCGLSNSGMQLDPHFGLHSRIRTIARDRSWNPD